MNTIYLSNLNIPCCIDEVYFQKQNGYIGFFGSNGFYKEYTFTGTLQVSEFSVHHLNINYKTIHKEHRRRWQNYFVNGFGGRRFMWRRLDWGPEGDRERMYLIPLDNLEDIRRQISCEKPKDDFSSHCGRYYNHTVADFDGDGVDSLVVLKSGCRGGTGCRERPSLLKIFDLNNETSKPQLAFEKDIGKSDFFYPLIRSVNTGEYEDVLLVIFPLGRFLSLDNVENASRDGILTRLWFDKVSEKYRLDKIQEVKTRNANTRIFPTLEDKLDLFSTDRNGRILNHHDREMNLLHKWRLGRDFAGLRLISELIPIGDGDCKTLPKGSVPNGSIYRCVRFLAIMSRTLHSCQELHQIVSGNTNKCAAKLVELKSNEEWSLLHEFGSAFKRPDTLIKTKRSLLIFHGNSLVILTLRNENEFFL